MDLQIKNNTERSKKVLSIFQIFYWVAFIHLFFQLYRHYVWSKYNFIPILDSWEGDYDYPEVVQFDIYYGLFMIVFIIVWIISVIRFIKWFRRAYCNLNRVGITTEKKEGWAAGAWFIPIYNIFAPQKIMKEIWQKTQNYYTEKAEEDTLVNQWWALWIICVVLDNQSDGIGESFLADGLQGQSIISIISVTLWIPLTYIVMKLIKKVSSFEKEMYEKAMLSSDNQSDEVIF